MATFINFGGGSGKQGFVTEQITGVANVWNKWVLVGKNSSKQCSFTTHLHLAQQSYTYYYSGILVGNLWIVIKNFWDGTWCSLYVYAMKDSFSPTASIEYGQAQDSHTYPVLATHGYNTGVKGGGARYDIQVNVNETNITIGTGGATFATIPITPAIKVTGDVYVNASPYCTVNKVYFVQIK